MVTETQKRVLLVTFTIHPPRSYDGLIEELTAGEWCHHIDYSWFVRTDETAQELWMRLEPHFKSTDRVFIVEVGEERSGWIPIEGWDWLQRPICVEAVL